MNKYFKRAAIIIISLVLIYTGLRIYLNYIFKSLVIDQVAQFADKNYELELGSIKIGWWAYHANISRLKLKKVGNIASKSDRFYFTIEAAHIKLKGLHLFDLLFYRQLELNKLEIIEPAISIFFNDTLKPNLIIDSTLIALEYSFSNIELQKPNIEIKTSSGKIIKIKSHFANYNFKKELLRLEKLKWKSASINKQDLELNCKINHATLYGFDLNTFINKSNFGYSDCNIDSIDVNLIANEAISLPSKMDRISFIQSSTILNLKFNPIKINNIHFEFKSVSSSMKVTASQMKYSKKQLTLEHISLYICKKHLLEANTDQLTISGFDIEKFIMNTHTLIENIIVLRPKIKMDLMNQVAAPIDHQTQKNSIALKIDSVLSFEIINGSFFLTNHIQKNLKLAINSINLKAQSFHPEYLEHAIDKRIVRKLMFQIGETDLNLNSNLYHLHLKRLKYNLLAESLTANGFSVVPNYKKNKFHAIVKKQIAMINLDLKTLTASGLNLNDLIIQNRFWCNEINAERLKVNFYKDKNIPLLPSDYKKFPQELLHELNFPILVKKINIKEAELNSEILNPGAKAIAQIKVDHVIAAFNHVDNQIYIGNQLNINFEGRLASSGLIKATAALDMYSSDFKHTVHAEIGTMPFKHLNNFMQDFAGIEINTGTLDKAIIDIKGNHKELNCKLDLSYHDLNMDIIRKQDKQDKSYRNVASLLANALIYNHNPELGKPLRSSTVEKRYISNKFIVGNWIAVSLKALLLTTAPKAANALQIDDVKEQEGSKNESKKPNLLNRLIRRNSLK